MNKELFMHNFYHKETCNLNKEKIAHLHYIMSWIISQGVKVLRNATKIFDIHFVVKK